MAGGRLALWNECQPEYLAEYETWYAGEHLPERLSLPGWVRGRRYENAGEGPGFFTYYEVSTPQDLIAPLYLERVNNPTPLTHRIMSLAFRNMSRTICSVAAVTGRMRGAWAVTQTGSSAGDLSWLDKKTGLARAELWREADLSAPDQNTEARLRGGDTTVSNCLFIETLRRSDAEDIAAGLPGAQIFRFLCELEAERR